jgi:RNA polymerase sigma-70 factor (ECF subfamily)
VHQLSEKFALHQEETPAVPAAGLGLSNRNVHRSVLEAAVSNLPASERLLFLLRDVEGYAPAMISRLLDIPEAKVQRTLFSARIRLRQALAEQVRTEAA